MQSITSPDYNHNLQLITSLGYNHNTQSISYMVAACNECQFISMISQLTEYSNTTHTAQ